MKRREDKHKPSAEIIVVALCLVLLVFFVSQKEGFHMDEMISFEMANAEYNPWIVTTQPEGRLAKFIHNEIDGDNLRETFGNIVTTVGDVIRNKGNSKLLTYKADVYEEPVWITGEQFRDYITAGKEDAFNYLSVYFNERDDVHPPLHSMLLHTVSSIFRGNARPWMGCAVNLAAVAAVLILLIKLGQMLAKVLGMERYSRLTGILCALLYGMSSGAVATVLLIRMYALLTLWCVAFLYLILKKWQDKSFDRHNKGLITVTMLGFWTQYFFLFYCLILAATVLVLLLMSKRIREFWYLMRSFIIAAVIGVALFPFSIAHVFASDRGEEAMEKLSQGISGYGERIAGFAGILWERTFAHGFWLLIVTGIVVCLVMRFRQRAGVSAGAAVKAGVSAKGAAGWGAYAALVLLPMAGYFFLAARMSPYFVDRYIMPLFPLAALAGGVLLVYVLSFLLTILHRGSENGQSDSRGGDTRNGSTWKGGSWDVFQLCACGICVLAILLQAGALAGYDNEYLYLGYRVQENVAAAHESEACVCIYDGVGYYENLKEFTHYDKSLLLTMAELENRRDTGSIEELGQFVLLVKGGVRVDDVLEIFAGKYGFVPQEQAISADSVHGDSIYVMIHD